MLASCFRWSTGRFSTLPSAAPARRWLCAPSEAAVEELKAFLKNASRPIMGQGKKKRCAGQRPLDLTKQLARLEGLDLPELVRMDTVALKKRGLPCAERKRILKFADKVKQGYTHDGKLGDWKSWRQPTLEMCPPMGMSPVRGKWL
uniref:Protein FYV4, mitochondrial n=1 Tax=Haptolina ericina TaxID=156174 RepID=A0A7S3ERV8_9EUKA|mmetsp:Transcript_1749/g.3903  ORF Transcript_1749/g.3903 Transcript_1749/m.3903 type:complete len:146 (+) Transcript_1749:57-494(+)